MAAPTTSKTPLQSDTAVSTPATQATAASSTEHKKDVSEKDPLRASDLFTAYGCESHAVYQTTPLTDERCLTDYEPLKLSTFRIFGIAKGTVLGESILWTEQCIMFMIFFSLAFLVMYYFRDDLEGSKVSVRRFIREQEPKMRQFCGIITPLCIFLLTFYTSIIVGRWWTMRTQGVGAIKAATVDLIMLINQCVTQDEQILSAVRRYGRTSLMLIFMWRRKQLTHLKEMLMHRELLDEEECDCLLKWNHCLHETIWAWQVSIIQRLRQAGKIKSDRLYGLLIEKCMDGRAAVQVCHTHVAVRMPMQYVHLLGVLVKLHNMILTSIMGLLWGAAYQNGQGILCVTIFLRICILPFLFNAILLINCNLADPFDGSESDFPGEIYQMGIDKDCKGTIAASENVPEWLNNYDAP